MVIIADDRCFLPIVFLILKEDFMLSVSDFRMRLLLNRELEKINFELYRRSKEACQNR